MIKYKFLNGFIYCNGFRMLMTSVVEALNEMDGELSKGKEDYKNLFEAFEEGQKVLGDANKRLENLSRVNKEYKEVLTPIWDYCRENVKVEPGKSMTEALIESNKELVTKVARLEQDAKNNELVHVGFTNGDQITYAKTEEGSFYPDTAGDCYIPLYMLKSHEHRIETTSIEHSMLSGLASFSRTLNCLAARFCFSASAFTGSCNKALSSEAIGFTSCISAKNESISSFSNWLILIPV